MNCKHKDAYKTYEGPDGDIYYCPDCGATLDENKDVIRTAKEIPY